MELEEGPRQTHPAAQLPAAHQMHTHSHTVRRKRTPPPPGCSAVPILMFASLPILQWPRLCAFFSPLLCLTFCPTQLQRSEEPPPSLAAESNRAKAARVRGTSLRMPSQRAVRSAQAFLGNAPLTSAREDLGLEDVPHNDEGLRRLAADANWSAVLLLAEQLAAETPHEVSAKLRYTLVQVTAHFSMQRYAAAKKLVDALGDLNSDRFIDPATNESVVPFSLRFISALLPSYCGTAMETQRRLYVLLDECQSHAGVAASPAWEARLKRVQRALVVSHYQAEQYAEAIRLSEAMISAERYDDEERADFRVLQQMLQLQQLATLCLHCGNTLLAEDVFRAIEGLSTADETDDVQQFHRFLLMLNRALWLTFNNKADEAAHIFREVARGTSEFCRDLGTAGTCPAAVPTVSLSTSATAGLAAARAQSALCQKAFHRLWVDAATSHVACIPYEATRNKSPTTLMAGIIGTLEGYLRQNPVELLHCDAFLSNSVRFYTLEGGAQQKKMGLLTDMLEVFRYERGCLPPLDKMV
ncbi:uncharacterized protein Tco025E_06584 [Trypanosoma conorhini]|uniref:Uncharacterized protein n=1 Tax=Trypanosoma conorhini TaxID=83891 RepID=A0A422P1R1_9TRYP|nr:uncharacterized protein Tco025E_06584 [Trypanosoma conorhini]RNF11650.1 hypothetical protein Tco025E_06584 [Trypanosoma conorhini]